MITKVAIGTKNPIKIEAIKEALAEIYKNSKDYEILFDSSESKVHKLPKSDKECIVGARNRSLDMLSKFQDADYGVGIEGGLDINDQGVFLCTWIIITSKFGKEAVACSPKILLPKKASKLVFEGKRMSEIMQLYVDDKDIKIKVGADGVLTSNLITRKTSTKVAFIYAFAKFMNFKYYAD